MSHDKDAACWCYTDIHRKEWLLVSFANQAAMASLDGAILGPVLPEAVDAAGHVALLPLLDIVVVGSFNNKTVSAYDWRTNKQLWRLSGLHELASVDCFDRHKILITQISGKCTEVDAVTGQQMGRAVGVSAVLADSMSKTIVLRRGSYKEPAYRIEFRTSLAEEPTAAFSLRDEFVLAAYGDGWLGMAEHHNGTLACFDYNGRELWRYRNEDTTTDWKGDSESVFHFRCICKLPSNKHIFAMQRSKAAPGNISGATAMIFDAGSGAMLFESKLSSEHLAYDALAEGGCLISRDGYLTLPDLRWNPRSYRLK